MTVQNPDPNGTPAAVAVPDPTGVPVAPTTIPPAGERTFTQAEVNSIVAGARKTLEGKHSASIQALAEQQTAILARLDAQATPTAPAGEPAKPEKKPETKDDSTEVLEAVKSLLAPIIARLDSSDRTSVFDAAVKPYADKLDATKRGALQALSADVKPEDLPRWLSENVVALGFVEAPAPADAAATIAIPSQVAAPALTIMDGTRPNPADPATTHGMVPPNKLTAAQVKAMGPKGVAEYVANWRKQGQSYGS